MREGAVGVSSSLEYAPAPYAKTDELIALASEASKFGGIYATHMRNESDAVLSAIDEALRIGREGHIPSKSGTSRAGENRTGDECPKLTRPGLKESTSLPTLMPIQHGLTVSPRLSLPGRTTVEMPS
jgi:N-acyl-D-amino-acid deacylase